MEQKKVEVKVPNISASAESTLKTVATILLIGGVIAALIFIFGIEDHAIGIGAGIGTFLSALASWAVLNVIANISLRLKAIQETMPLRLVWQKLKRPKTIHLLKLLLRKQKKFLSQRETLLFQE